MHICMNYVYNTMYVKVCMYLQCLLYITHNFYSFLDSIPTRVQLAAYYKTTIIYVQ